MLDHLPRAPVTILLVEDNEGDARLVAEALRDGAINFALHHVHDGVEALDFLERRGLYKASPRPDLVILDLNLPRKDGRQFLAEMKTMEAFKQIPVIVLSISDFEEDITTCYRLHANCYITKPLEYKHFARVIRSIEEFWLTTVRLPGSVK